MAISPFIQYFAGKLGTIIDGNGLGKTDSLRSYRQCGNDFAPTDERISHKQWASSGILIDDGENTQGVAVSQPIAHKSPSTTDPRQLKPRAVTPTFAQHASSVSSFALAVLRPCRSDNRVSLLPTSRPALITL